MQGVPDRVLCHRHSPHHFGQRERGHVHPGPKVQVQCMPWSSKMPHYTQPGKLMCKSSPLSKWLKSMFDWAKAQALTTLIWTAKYRDPQECGPILLSNRQFGLGKYVSQHLAVAWLGPPSSGSLRTCNCRLATRPRKVLMNVQYNIYIPQVSVAQLPFTLFVWVWKPYKTNGFYCKYTVCICCLGQLSKNPF